MIKFLLVVKDEINNIENIENKNYKLYNYIAFENSKKMIFYYYIGLNNDINFNICLSDFVSCLINTSVHQLYKTIAKNSNVDSSRSLCYKNLRLNLLNVI